MITRNFGLTILKISTVALFAVPTLFVSSGCSPECTDKFDCRSIEALPENLATGKKFTCDMNKCVPCAARGCPGEGLGGGAGGGTAGTGGGTAGDRKCTRLNSSHW